MFKSNKLYGLKSKEILLQILGLKSFKKTKMNDQISTLLKEVFIEKATGEQLDEPKPETDLKNYRTIVLNNRKDNIKFQELKRSWKRLHRLLLVNTFLEDRKYIQSTKKETAAYINAALHSRGKFFFKLDISNFFGTTYFLKVQNFFQKHLAMSQDCAALLAELTCFKHADGKFSLGQGFPTSPILAMLVNIEMFEEIDMEIQSYNKNIKYSVYVDDLTFSSNEPIKGDVQRGIKRIINKHRYKINSSKEEVAKISKNKPVVVTGIGIFADKIVPWSKNDESYRKQMDSIIEKFNEYASKRLNDKMLYTLLNKTKHGSPLFQRYFGIFNYFNSATEHIDKSTTKQRRYRAWKKYKIYYESINKEILKLSKLWNKKVKSHNKSEELTFKDKRRIKYVLKRISKIEKAPQSK